MVCSCTALHQLEKRCHALCCAVQDFWDFFEDLNAYWVAPFVNIVFVVVAVLAQLFLSSSWGIALSNQLGRSASDLKAKGSNLPHVEQQQLLPDAVPRLPHQDSVIIPASPRCSEHCSTWQTESVVPQVLQVELSHVAGSFGSSNSMPRRRSQPHLPGLAGHQTSPRSQQRALDA